MSSQLGSTPGRRGWLGGTVLCTLAIGIVLATAAWPACDLSQARGPRTLVLALDGVPLRLARHAWETGSFAGWPQPRPLVSPFPSMTNVAFTAMLAPLGVSPIAGYETRHFDLERNRLLGGGAFGYEDRAYGWRDLFDVVTRTNRSKIGLYLRPRRRATKKLSRVVRTVLESSDQVVLAHVAATDLLAHVRGDEAVLDVLRDVDERIGELLEAHRRRRGEPLAVVLLSDHGNGAEKVRNVSGLRRTLRRAGFRFRKQLGRPGSVVTTTYGAVGYAAFYLDRSRAEEASRALAGLEGVDLAAWQEGPSAIRVVSARGEARVLWRHENGTRRFAYRDLEGDPLALGPIVSSLARRGRLAEDGFASAEVWLRRTVEAPFPDPLRRLVDALAGTWVENPATVLVSLEPGYAWGLDVVRLGAFLLGGRQEATHGGLDRDSTLGFQMSLDPALQPAGPATMRSALEALRARGCSSHLTAD